MKRLAALLQRLFRRRAPVRTALSVMPLEPIRFGVFDRYPGNGHAVVILYRDPDGKITRDGCWWMPDNRNHQAQPRFFMVQCLRAVADGLVERVHGPKP